MPTDQADNLADHSFADNWDYLRTELRWLDQVLMMAIARQKKETQEVDRIAQTRADRVTSHWWRGIVTIEGNIAYDEHRQPPAPTTGLKGSYQQQLDARIQASWHRGILLGLPCLRDRLQLSTFEKNLVLMSLAPEVNRRYAKLYRFLQGEDAPLKTDLPTLDLVMRLMCRNDGEWRTARSQLTAPSRLFQYGLVQLTPCPTDTFLNQPLRLSDQLLCYLLAEKPTYEALDRLLQSSLNHTSVQDEWMHPKLIYTKSVPDQNSSTTISSTSQVFRDEFTDKFSSEFTHQLPNRSLQNSIEVPAIPLHAPSFLQVTSASVPWTELILPTARLKALKFLAQRIASVQQVTTQWGFELENVAYRPGAIALFSGAAGTGKTLAAQAIAHHLNTSLYQIDLALIEPHDYPTLLTEIEQQTPTVLLIKSADLWFNRAHNTRATLVAASVEPLKLQRLLGKRLQTATLTILAETLTPTGIGLLAETFLETDLIPESPLVGSLEVGAAQALTDFLVRHLSQQYFDFPLPNKRQRLKLWQKAFPVQAPLAREIDWAILAGETGLSGGEIRSIAYEAALYAASVGAAHINFDHISWAIDRWGGHS